VDPDFSVRAAAIEHLHALSRRYDDMIPRVELLRRLEVAGRNYPLPIDEPDNRALRAAFAEQVPLIYLMGVAPSVYALAAPVYVVEDRPQERSVLVQIGSWATDMSPAGLRSDPDVRRYALQEVRHRLHQHRFSFQVLAA